MLLKGKELSGVCPRPRPGMREESQEQSCKAQSSVHLVRQESAAPLPLLGWDEQTHHDSSPFLPPCSVGLLGTIKGVGRKASGEGATRSEEFLYVKRESQVIWLQPRVWHLLWLNENTHLTHLTAYTLNSISPEQYLRLRRSQTLSVFKSKGKGND